MDAMPAIIDKTLDREISSIESRYEPFREDFVKSGFLHVPKFLSADLLEHLRKLWELIKPESLRKDIVIQDKTVSARKMRTASGTTIDRHTSDIARIYQNERLIRFFELISNDTICLLEDSIEKYVINALELDGDLHGAHLDSFPYACTLIIFGLEAGQGGLLRISKTIADAEAGIGTDLSLGSGDLFFFCSDNLVHQVTAIRAPGQRVALNFAYANPKNKRVLSYSRDVLYT